MELYRLNKNIPEYIEVDGEFKGKKYIYSGKYRKEEINPLHISKFSLIGNSFECNNTEVINNEELQSE